MLAQGRVRTRVSSGSGVDRYHLATMTAFSKLRGQNLKGKSHPPFVHLRQSSHWQWTTSEPQAVAARGASVPRLKLKPELESESAGGLPTRPGASKS